MKPLTIVAALAAVLLSCSKPAQEATDSSAVDSTNVNADPNAGTAQREVYQKPIELAGDDLERLKAKLFLYLHNREVLNGEQMMVQEDFDFSNNTVTYDIGIYNKIHTDYDGAGNRIMREDEPTKEVYMSPDENMTAPATEPVNEIDEVSYSLTNIKVYDISAPESRTKRVRVMFVGSRTWANAPSMSTYGVTQYSSEESGVPQPIDLDLGDVAFGRNELYLKAKIAALTEADLDGMTKDQLGYLRNEIFARHGHTFKTPKMKDYFAKQSWYFSIYDDALEYLNAFEKQNVDFIKKREG